MKVFISPFFYIIPHTAFSLNQGGYYWVFLAYAVGFSCSMFWFGSSAGVALSNIYPEAKSVGAWLKGGWHVAVGYVVGFFVLLFVLGWHPDPLRSKEMPAAAAVAAPASPTISGQSVPTVK